MDSKRKIVTYICTMAALPVLAGHGEHCAAPELAQCLVILPDEMPPNNNVQLYGQSFSVGVSGSTSTSITPNFPRVINHHG
jgi:hypothetical protein